MKLGFIGLGKMGNRMVTKLVGEGHDVVVWNRTKEKAENLKIELRKLEVADSIEDLIKKLDKPRIVWCMLPAGEATETTLNEIAKYLNESDILIDGGNSRFSDTQRRFGQYSKQGLKYLGIGVSGGVIAVKEGYPMMVGGNRQAYDYIKPILDSLAKPAPNSTGSGPGGGHEYFGKGGAGHFVKMVHNGIEYGVMQSIGEGFGVMEKSPYKLDLLKVAKLYQQGTLNSGFMMERTIEALEKDPDLSQLEGVVNASGEGEWTIEEAKKEKVPINVIEESFNFRLESQKDKKVSSSFAARMVAALRNAFGGHDVKKKN